MRQWVTSGQILGVVAATTAAAPIRLHHLPSILLLRLHRYSTQHKQLRAAVVMVVDMGLERPQQGALQAAKLLLEQEVVVITVPILLFPRAAMPKVVLCKVSNIQARRQSQ
jgi:hypothetical protein